MTQNVLTNDEAVTGSKHFFSFVYVTFETCNNPEGYFCPSSNINPHYPTVSCIEPGNMTNLGVGGIPASVKYNLKKDFLRHFHLLVDPVASKLLPMTGRRCTL
jgi:hypothetical protein